MAGIKLKPGETLESALQRFKKDCGRAGVLSAAREKEAYMKPSDRKRKKHEESKKKAKKRGKKCY